MRPKNFPGPGLLPRRHAFTLVELLAVTAIVGVLASLALLVVGRARQSARASVCRGNLRQIGNAFHLYAAENRGLFPAARWRSQDVSSGMTNPSQGNWQIEIAPFLARDTASANFYNAYSPGGDSYAFCPEYIARYRDSADWGKVQSGGYGMNNKAIPDGVWSDRFMRLLIAAPARTILIGDSTDYHLNIPASGWPAKTGVKCGDYESGDPLRHGTTANYLFADGHVLPLSPEDALASLSQTPSS